LKRYDSSRIVRLVLTPQQKEWLKEQAVGMDSMSAVIRRLIDQAMNTKK